MLTTSTHCIMEGDTYIIKKESAHSNALKAILIHSIHKILTQIIITCYRYTNMTHTVHTWNYASDFKFKS
jgi:hypothetical protein